MSGLSCFRRPGPWRITFDTNPDCCNLRCIMCEEHSIYRNRRKKNVRTMDIALVQEVVESTVPFGLKEIIPSTMGEPLLYPHFQEIVELAIEYEVKINLTTNGTFPKRGVEQWGEMILPVASDVKISINGASPATAEAIMQGIDFERQLADIARFIELRDEVRIAGRNYPTVTFQVTYMERNLGELSRLLKLAIEMKVDRFKGHHLWITWPELEKESLRRDDETLHRWNITVERLEHIAEHHRLPNGTRIRLDNVYRIPNILANSGVPREWMCPFLGREAWIAWDSTFNVCCSPDSLRKSLGYFGNVKETDFMELWNSKGYQSLISNWGNYEVCKTCNMRKPQSDIARCEE